MASTPAPKPTVPAEAKPIEPATITTRTPLSQVAHAKIVQCSAVLPSKLQCWRAGDVQVTKIDSFPATEENPSGTKTTQYQVCYFHNSIEEQQEADQLTKPVA